MSLLGALLFAALACAAVALAAALAQELLGAGAGCGCGEGFESGGAEAGVLDDPAQFYDAFYVQRIDQAYFPEGKNLCRCSELLRAAYAGQRDTRTLLAGANTGRFLDALSGITQATALAAHPALAAAARRQAPAARVVEGSFADAQFAPGAFTHVVFEDRSLYELAPAARAAALRRAREWTRPGGTLVLRVVERERFDPMAPAAVPLPGLNVQDYLARRETDSRVAFRDGSALETSFTLLPSEDRALLKERLFRADGSLLRTQVHRWSMPDRDAVVAGAVDAGWRHAGSLPLAPCTARGEFYEIFRRPEGDAFAAPRAD